MTPQAILRVCDHRAAMGARRPAARIPEESMQIVITAVGPDNVGLADPIIHYVTGQGANISEIQMYDHDEESALRHALPHRTAGGRLPALRTAMREIGRRKNLSIRVWSPEERAQPPAVGHLHHLSARDAAGAVAGHSRRPDQGRGGGDDRQPPGLPRPGRTVWRAVGEMVGDAAGGPERRATRRRARRARRRLRRSGPLHARAAAGDLLEVRRRAGSSTCITACCRAFPACDRITMRTPAAC